VERSGINRVSAGFLLGGPVLMVIGRLLLVPMDDQKWDATLTQAAAHQGRSDAGWILAMAAAGLLGASALALAALLRGAAWPKAAAVAAITTAAGWAGCAGICTAGMMLSYQGKAPDRAVQVQLLKDLNAGHTGFIFLLCVVAAVGYVVLSVALARAHVIGKTAAVLIGLGGAGTLLTMPGPMKPLLVLTALLLLAGHVLVVRAVGVRSGAATPSPVWEPVAA
jgi:hypothetical protein